MLAFVISLSDGYIRMTYSTTWRFLYLAFSLQYLKKIANVSKYLFSLKIYPIKSGYSVIMPLSTYQVNTGLMTQLLQKLLIGVKMKRKITK